MMQRILGIITIWTFSVLMSTANAAFSDLLYECPFAGSGGDLTSRAFYLENYSSSTLGGVILGFFTRSAGQYTIELEARADTFDGPLIGTASRTVDLNISSFPNLEVEFDFANAPVTTTSSIVTFKIQITSGAGTVFFDTGTGACTDVVKTNGSTPPLDTPRFNGVGVEVYGTSGAAAPTYTVGGTVSGLTGTGLALQNNGTDTLAVAAAATNFTFATELPDLATYAVTVSTQPTGQICSVTGGDNSIGGGAIAGADVTNVIVTCVDDVVPTYSIGGTVSGLTGTGLELQNNGGDTLAVAAAAIAFTFATELPDLATYAVTVSTQPTGQTCSVTDDSGTIATADINNVSVACVDDVAPPAPVVPIPTMSQWALILFSTLLGLMVFVNRRRLF